METRPIDESIRPDPRPARVSRPEPDSWWAIDGAETLAVVYWGPPRTVFRTVPLDLGQWGVIVAVGSTVILGGEPDKTWRRRRGRDLG